MNFYDVINNRKSIRSFQSTEISWETIFRLSETFRHSPSAGNLRAYGISIVMEPEVKQQLVGAALDQTFIAEAPVVFVFFSIPAMSAKKYGERGANLYSIQDATIAATYLQLAAVEEGLGTCWVGAFDEVKVSEILKLSAGHRPLVIMPIGYPKTI